MHSSAEGPVVSLADIILRDVRTESMHFPQGEINSKGAMVWMMLYELAGIRLNNCSNYDMRRMVVLCSNGAHTVQW